MKDVISNIPEEITLALQKAGLWAGQLEIGKIGHNHQVRQSLYARDGDGWRPIAFFCRNQVPAKTIGYPQRPARLEYNQWLRPDDNILPAEEKAAAEKWLEYMLLRHHACYGDLLFDTDHPLP